MSNTIKFSRNNEYLNFRYHCRKCKRTCGNIFTTDIPFEEAKVIVSKKKRTCSVCNPPKKPKLSYTENRQGIARIPAKI